MSQTSVSSQSTWRSKIKAMGPGILMASAAVGGSHIVSSTQAGGSYGWALLGLVILHLSDSSSIQNHTLNGLS